MRGSPNADHNRSTATSCAPNTNIISAGLPPFAEKRTRHAARYAFCMMTPSSRLSARERAWRCWFKDHPLLLTGSLMRMDDCRLLTRAMSGQLAGGAKRGGRGRRTTDWKKRASTTGISSCRDSQATRPQPHRIPVHGMLQSHMVEAGQETAMKTWRRKAGDHGQTVAKHSRREARERIVENTCKGG